MELNQFRDAKERQNREPPPISIKTIPHLLHKP